MDLKELLITIKKERILVFILTILFAFVGLAANYLLPPWFYASGSLFVKRAVYPYAEDHFTYEGYYGQQAAIEYTNSIISLIESEDVRAATLQKLGADINEKNLRTYDKKIKTTKAGPQVITVTTRGKTREDAEALWKSVTDSTLASVTKISSANDPFIGITKISEKPVLKENYTDPSVFSVTGMLIGFALSTLVLAVKSYFSDLKKQRK